MENEYTLSIGVATKEEQLFCRPLSPILGGMTGCVGSLRYNFSMEGPVFVNEEGGLCDQLKEEGFEELQKQVVKCLKGTASLGKPLENRESLETFCAYFPEAKMEEGYVFRMDFGPYTYMVKMDPTPGVYNLYAPCYLRKFLEEHLEKAAYGFSFPCTPFCEGFTLQDGDKLQEVDNDGRKTIYTFRFLDDNHLELQSPFESKIYHIEEYLEKLEREKKMVWPCEQVRVQTREREVEI